MDKNGLIQLKREVAKHLRGKANDSSISWYCSVVGIQDVLLDEPPSEYHGGPLRVRIKKAAYAKILAAWKKNFVGGSKTFFGQESHCQWNPPKGAKLFSLDNGLCFDTNESFYILYFGKRKYVFLQKLDSGEDDVDDLRVIDGWGAKDNTQLFEAALRHALEPEEKN